MSFLLERFRQCSARISKYEAQYDSVELPRCRHHWILEADLAHAGRLKERLEASLQGLDVVRASAATAFTVNGYKGGTSPPALLYLSRNVIVGQLCPVDMLRYITRHFYCNNAARCEEMMCQKALKVLQAQYTINGVAKVRVQASPRSLEVPITAALQALDTAQTFQFQGALDVDVMLLQVVYSPQEAIFRWGVSIPDFVKTQLLTHIHIHKMSQAEEEQDMPVCRAYYKLKEVMQLLLTTNPGSKLRTSSEHLAAGCAVDVGASPGGWTQVMSPYFHKVLAIDPGKVEECVLAMKNVTYIPEVVESPTVQAHIRSRKGSSGLLMVACDINAQPRFAAQLLAKHCLPHLHGIRDASRDDGGGAFVVLTLKMLKNPKPFRIQEALTTVREIFVDTHRCLSGDMECYCWHFELLHLAANSSNERTIIAKLH